LTKPKTAQDDLDELYQYLLKDRKTSGTIKAPVGGFDSKKELWPDEPEKSKNILSKIKGTILYSLGGDRDE